MYTEDEMSCIATSTPVDLSTSTHTRKVKPKSDTLLYMELLASDSPIKICFDKIDDDDDDNDDDNVDISDGSMKDAGNHGCKVDENDSDSDTIVRKSTDFDGNEDDCSDLDDEVCIIGQPITSTSTPKRITASVGNRPVESPSYEGEMVVTSGSENETLTTTQEVSVEIHPH